MTGSATRRTPSIFPSTSPRTRVAHQWWAHQVISAYVEGATSIDETLAQYTALMVMKHHFGDEEMKRFLRFELDQYLRGRAHRAQRGDPALQGR